MPESNESWEKSEAGLFCREHEIRNRITPADFSTFEKGVKSFHTAKYLDSKDITELLPIEFCEELGIKAVQFTEKYIRSNRQLVDKTIEKIYPDLLERCKNHHKYAVEISWRFCQLYDPYFDEELLEPIFLTPGDIIYEGYQSVKGYFGGRGYAMYKYTSDEKYECIYTWGLILKYIGMKYTDVKGKIIPSERLSLIKDWEQYMNGRSIDLSYIRKI